MTSPHDSGVPPAATGASRRVSRDPNHVDTVEPARGTYDDHPRTGSGTADTDHQPPSIWTILWILLALVTLAVLVAAFLVAVDRGFDWHWLLWGAAAVSLIAAVLYFFGKLVRQWKALGWLLLLGSILFSLLTIGPWLNRLIEPDALPPGPVVTAPVNPDESIDPTLEGLPPAAPAPPVAPNPNVDEIPFPGAAVSAASELQGLRDDATNIRIGGPDADYLPGPDGYADAELAELARRQLEEIANTPESDPKFASLARHEGLSQDLGNGTLNGKVLSDYMRDNAYLDTVGPEGLRVNHFDYDDAGKLEFCHELDLEQHTLIWRWKNNNEPFAVYNGLGRIAPTG